MRDRRATAASRQSPPGPYGFPLVGHLPFIARDVLGFFTSCARQHGDVAALRLGWWPALLLSNPDDIETVLVRNHRAFVKNSFFWRQVAAIFGNGLLTSEGDFWRRQRHLSAPAFSGKLLESYGGIMVRYTEQMLSGWEAGQVRDVHADMMALTLKIAAKTLFDFEVERDVEEIDRAVTVLTDEIASRFARPVVIPDAVPLPGHIRYQRGLRRIEAVIARVIRERRARNTSSGDFLSMLMQARDETGRGMSDQQLRDEAITLLLAGHETTALALSWTWYLLGRHPEAQKHLAAEVEQVLGSRSATVEDIRRLTFAEWVVKEAMRLYPPAWAIGREAFYDTEIGGYSVRAGTTIFISPWVIHRDPHFFSEPDAFRPERWGDGLADRLPRFAYFPFGGGPRVCIGSRFAMMEAVLILVTIARRFWLEGNEIQPVTPFPSITLRPRGGVQVQVRDRPV